MTNPPKCAAAFAKNQRKRPLKLVRNVRSTSNLRRHFLCSTLLHGKATKSIKPLSETVKPDSTQILALCFVANWRAFTVSSHDLYIQSCPCTSSFSRRSEKFASFFFRFPRKPPPFCHVFGRTVRYNKLQFICFLRETTAGMDETGGSKAEATG